MFTPLLLWLMSSHWKQYNTPIPITDKVRGITAGLCIDSVITIACILAFTSLIPVS